MSLTQNMKEKINAAIRDSKKQIIDAPELGNRAHAEAFAAITKCFGAKPCGFIYVEATLPKQTHKPADIVLCDTSTGVMVVEVKGYTIDFIKRVIGGTVLSIKRKGRQPEVNPWEQARDCMFDIQDAFRRKFYQIQAPWFTYMVAFPFIRKREWVEKFGKDSIAFNQVIFQDDIENLNSLKIKVIERTIPPNGKNPVKNPIDVERIQKVREVFSDSAVLNKNRSVRKVEEVKLGAELDRLESMDKYLSDEQQSLSDLKLDGKPRLVRGVAGSGKTVVLANIFANYIKNVKRHGIQEEFEFTKKQDRPFKVAVVCYNKTLVPFIKEKISLSYQNQTGRDLEFDSSIHITHFDKFLKDLLITPGIVGNELWSYKVLEDRAEYANKSMRAYIAKGINLEKLSKYDAIFIDEGQDFNEQFFTFLKDLLQSYENKKNENIVIFYDDAQNIYGTPRPNWSFLGIDVIGRSKVMRKCFRNTLPIITLAYNVLLGKKTDNKVSTDSKQFADLGYLKNIDLVTEENGIYRIFFAEREGPIPEVKKFPNFESEVQWICEKVKILVEKEHVRPEDIVVMTYRKKNCEKLASALKCILKDSERIKKIVNAHHDEEKHNLIMREDCLTVSTIHGVKGYDANIVFLAGVNELNAENMFNYDEEQKQRCEAEARAVFYVGATRAKYLLYISGIKAEKPTLLDEIEKIHMHLQERNIYKD